MQNLDFWIAVAGLVTALSVDLVNMRFLIKLWKWSQEAGVNLINQVRSSLNLKHGLSKPISQSIVDTIKTEDLQELIRDNPEVAQDFVSKIDPMQLLQGVLSGQLKVDDVKPLILPFLRESMANPESENISGDEVW